ncbi:hypothetical protein BJX76DRAFT_304558 [Aspergillus varians]
MDPVAPSLLWAYELRRENVQLVDKMEKINSILTSATNAINVLHESIEILTTRVHELEEQREHRKQEVDSKIQELEEQREHDKRKFDSRIQELENDRRESNERTARLEEALARVGAFGAENEVSRGPLGEVSEKVGTLATENGTLKGNLDNALHMFGKVEKENEELKERICALENEASVQEKQVARVVKWMSMKTMGEDKEKRDQDQDTHIPDSIPTPRSHLSAPVASHRSLSETTWGSLTDLDAPCVGSKRVSSTDSPLRKENAKSADQKMLDSISQEHRTLTEYLSLTDALRTHRPSIPEEVLVMAFTRGLNDMDLRNHIVELTRHAGLTWESVVSHVQDVIQGQAVGEQGDGKPTDTSGKRHAAGGSVGKRKEHRNTRRTIPIVPADEEDELFVT